MVHGIYDVCCTHIKHTNSHRPNRGFWFHVVSTQLHFGTLWRTWRTCSRSKHESFCTSLRQHVVPTHSDWTPDCLTPFTNTHELSLLYLSSFLTENMSEERDSGVKSVKMYLNETVQLFLEDTTCGKYSIGKMSDFSQISKKYWWKIRLCVFQRLCLYTVSLRYIFTIFTPDSLSSDMF